MEPQRIRIIYFDESADTLARFVARCENAEKVEVACVFRSLNGIARSLQEDDYRFLALLAPDAAVLRLRDCAPGVREGLRAMRARCRIKTIGLLSGAGAALADELDYATEAPSADSLVTEEDAYTHLFYQIRSAQLALNVEKAGVKGKWAILPPPPKFSIGRRFRLIAVGASAGGTEAVSKIFAQLPGTLPPILLVQHIPDNFTEFFANNLAQKVAMRVVVARGGERLEDGTVYIAGHDKHMEAVRGEDGDFYLRCTYRDKVSGHRPSVDALFMSVAKAAGASALGVILTGMGCDGAQGLLEMREAGAYTIGQDKATCAVYGMPMVAYTMGAVLKQLPLDAIAPAIISAAGADRAGGAGHA